MTQVADREQFLDRIAARLRRPREHAAPVREVRGAPEFWVDYDLPLQERVEKFTHELTQLGAMPHVYEDQPSLAHGLSQLMNELTPKLVVSWAPDLLAPLGIEDILAHWSAQIPDGDDSLDTLRMADVGITAVDAAIADTGTLMLCAGVGKPRLVSLMPAVHIAIVRASQLFTRLGEALRHVRETTAVPPSAVMMISGPSRSSDIENDLTIGVHGPVAVHVLIWKDVTISV